MVKNTIKDKILILNLPGLVLKSGSRWMNTTKKGVATLRYYPYPWFMGYATSLLKKNGYSVVFKDAVALEWTPKQTKEFVETFEPRYLVCDPTTVSREEDEEFLKSLYKDIVIITVGNYATNFPNECLEFADYAVVGEYEFSLLEFFDSGTKKLPINFVSKKKQIYRRPPMLNLDLLPYPERNDTPIKYYNEPSCYGKNVVMVSSRGCRLKCNFCIVEDVYGSHIYRTRSPKSVIDEMKNLVENYDFDEIYFDDDNMVSNKKHIDEICKEKIKRGLKIPWLCMGDGLVDDETLELLAKANCTTYKWGLEHLDEEVLKAIPKPLKSGRQLELIKKCKKLGIRSYANLMVGLPKSTFEKDIKMIHDVINADADMIQISIATPLRGTVFWKQAEANNWFIYDKKRVDATGESIITYPDYPAEKISEAFNLGWKIWRKHVLFKKPKTLFFFLSSEVRRNGFLNTLSKSLSYLYRLTKEKAYV